MKQFTDILQEQIEYRKYYIDNSMPLRKKLRELELQYKQRTKGIEQKIRYRAKYKANMIVELYSIPDKVKEVLERFQKQGSKCVLEKGVEIQNIDHVATTSQINTELQIIYLCKFIILVDSGSEYGAYKHRVEARVFEGMIKGT